MISLRVFKKYRIKFEFWFLEFPEFFLVNVFFPSRTHRLILILFLRACIIRKLLRKLLLLILNAVIFEIYVYVRWTESWFVNPHDAMARERALESSMEDLADSLSCISVSARRRGLRYLLGDLPTICQRSTGRVPALSNIYQTPLPPYVYCGELSRMHVCACIQPIRSPACGAPRDRRFFLHDRFESSFIFRAYVPSTLIRISNSVTYKKSQITGNFNLLNCLLIQSSRIKLGNILWIVV